MAPVLARILRFPVKGLSAEAMDRARLRPGQGLPGDRRFALALADTPVESETPWLPRERLLNLTRFPRLAQLDTRFEQATNRLSIRRRGRLVLEADFGTAHGRAVVSAFFAAYLAGETFGHPRLVERPDEGFFDRHQPMLSLIGDGTLAELARIGGCPRELAEMRINLLVAGLEPRQELDWTGCDLRLGGAVLRVVEPIERSVLPELLQATFGHRRLGVWAEVVEGGEIALGQDIDVGKRPDSPRHPSGYPAR